MKYFLFDLDGTLTDPKEGITKSVDYALKSFGIQTKNLDDLCKFIGPPLKKSFCEFYNFSDTDAEIAIKKYREYFSEKGIYQNSKHDGIDRMLKKLLEQDKVLIIATSKPTVFAIKILEYFNILDYFEFVAGSELDGTRCNKSEVILHALKENNITDLSDVIMIGDRKHDIIGAKEAGIKSVGILHGYGDLEELQKAKADYIVEDINQLELLLTKEI